MSGKPQFNHLTFCVEAPRCQFAPHPLSLPRGGLSSWADAAGLSPAATTILHGSGLDDDESSAGASEPTSTPRIQTPATFWRAQAPGHQGAEAGPVLHRWSSPDEQLAWSAHARAAGPSLACADGRRGLPAAAWRAAWGGRRRSAPVRTCAAMATHSKGSMSFQKPADKLVAVAEEAAEESRAGEAGWAS